MDSISCLAQEMFTLMDSAKRLGPEQMNAAMRGEMAVLRLLEHEDRALMAGEISRELCMTTSRIAAVLNSLEKKGLVARETDSRDRRRVMVCLTEAGAAICQKKKEQIRQNMEMLMRRLGEEDARALVHLTRRVQEAMAELRSECGAEGCFAPETEETDGKEE